MKEEKSWVSTKKMISDIMLNDKYKKIIVIAGLSGIFLIFASSFFKHKPAKINQPQLPPTEQYIVQMQDRLKAMISNIEGAGVADVLVTLESGQETVYAKEEKKNKETSEDKECSGELTKKKESDDTEQKYITIKESDGAEKALAIKEVQPIVKGVVIVCQGGNNPAVSKKITEAVRAALNISMKRIYVTR